MQKRAPTSGQSENQSDYQAAFLRRVHQLLQCGYERMHPVKQFELWKEEEISGELGRHVDEVLDEIRAPWMRFYSLAPERHVDEPHVPLPGRLLGKRRKRLDFRFTCRQRAPVQRFIFEAKLLKQSSAAQLLDKDGLGRILQGQYARDDAAAGLLGYVQIADVATHVKVFEDELSTNPADYGITAGGTWTKVKLSEVPTNTYRTKHKRPPLPEVTIYTTFLLFR